MRAEAPPTGAAAPVRLPAEADPEWFKVLLRLAEEDDGEELWEFPRPDTLLFVLTREWEGWGLWEWLVWFDPLPTP